VFDKSLTQEGNHTAVRSHKTITALMNDKRVENFSDGLRGIKFL